MKKKLVVLTGAGMSAESGISTFRDSDGLWEKSGGRCGNPRRFCCRSGTGTQLL